MQVTPVDATPGWVNALGGAGGAYRGFMQAQALTQQLENDNKRLKLQQDEAERRNGLANLAEQELELQYEQHRAKQESEAGRRAGNQALNQATLLSQIGLSRIEGIGGGFDAIGDEGMADLPPEWGQSSQLLQEALRNKEIEPKDFAAATHEIGKMQSTILRRQASKDLADQILRDSRPDSTGTSFWGRFSGEQQQGADGKPVPSAFDADVDDIWKRLGDPKEDPLLLAAEYETKRTLADEEFNSQQALNLAADDFLADVVAPNQKGLGPGKTGKLIGVAGALRRGDYGTGDAALNRARIEAFRATAGTRQIAIGGKLVDVEEKDYESIMGQLGRLEDKSKEPPEISILTPFAKMVGEFKYNPDDMSADFEQQHARWMKAVRTTRDEFMGGGQQTAPGGTTQPPPLIRNGAQPNQAPPGNSPPAVQPGQAPPRNVPTWDTANESQRAALTRMLDRASDADARAIRNDPALQAFIDSMPEDEFRKLVPKKKAASPPDRGSNGGGSK